MNYELAKQLKHAGFPQEGDNRDEVGCYRGRHGEHGFLYYPTLEELIEACGEDFWSLTYLMGSPATWKATADRSTLRQSEPETYTTGTTPTEAVARLWVALNKV